MKTTSYLNVCRKLGTFIKCQAPAANCNVAYFTKGAVYCSYEAVIAILIYSEAWYYTKYHDYSKTTCLHAMKMINCSSTDRNKALAEGYAIFIDDYERP